MTDAGIRLEVDAPGHFKCSSCGVGINKDEEVFVIDKKSGEVRVFCGLACTRDDCHGRITSNV